jgi:hypothetical protein
MDAGECLLIQRELLFLFQNPEVPSILMIYSTCRLELFIFWTFCRVEILHLFLILMVELVGTCSPPRLDSTTF